MAKNKRQKNNDAQLTIHYQMTQNEILIGSLHALYASGLLLLAIAVFYKIDLIFSLNTPVINFVDTLTKSILLSVSFIFLLGICAICTGMIILYVRYRHFEIASDEHNIYISKGNAGSKNVTIPRSTLQSVSIKKPLTQHLFQLVTIKLHYVDATNSSELIQTAILIPFIKEQRGKQLTGKVLPSKFMQESLKSLPGEAYFIELIQPSYLLVIVTYLIMFFSPELWFVPIFHALYLIVKRVVKTKRQKYSWTDDVISIRDGVFSPTLHLIKREHITMLQIHQSWIQRKLKLATCQLTTRNKTVQLNHVNEAVVTQLYDWFIQNERI